MFIPSLAFCFKNGLSSISANVVLLPEGTFLSEASAGTSSTILITVVPVHFY